MNILATVCKSGGDFGPADVNRLIQRISRHMPGFGGDPAMVCLTDFEGRDFDVPPFPVRLITLKHDWPGWWSKIELFRPGLFSRGDRVIYLDLDTVPTGDFSDLWNWVGDDGCLTMLRDFYRPEFAASGVMGWNGGNAEEIHSDFKDNPHFLMKMYNNGTPRGDGHFIAASAKVNNVPIDYWQDRFPGRLVSYKAHCQRGVPSGASLVCFHGRPRPTEVDEPWL